MRNAYNTLQFIGKLRTKNSGRPLKMGDNNKRWAAKWIGQGGGKVEESVHHHLGKSAKLLLMGGIHASMLKVGGQ